jgi:pilus assembly protein Flp/PilA
MTRICNSMREFVHREEGATMVEYGLMVALIAIVAIAAVTLLGVNVRDIFNEMAGLL